MSDLGAGSRINPMIAVDDQGSAYAVWQRFYGCVGSAITGDIEFARQPAGAGWERPVRVSADIGSSNASPPVIAASRDRRDLSGVGRGDRQPLRALLILPAGRRRLGTQDTDPRRRRQSRTG